MHDITATACYRCGYNLDGIADDQACPECGLLAERSRRVGDELHLTRPRWLGRLSRGTWLILLSLLTPLPLLVLVINALELWGPSLFNMAAGIGGIRKFQLLATQLPILVLDVAAGLFTAGVLLLSSREGYPPADAADAGLRSLLRLTLLALWTALAFMHIQNYLEVDYPGFRESGMHGLMLTALALGTFGCTPLPILLSLRFRGLAQRARSAHLAEHCVIVGIGAAVTIVYIFAVLLVMWNGEAWGLRQYWQTRGVGSLLIMALMGTMGMLFALWAIYLMIRFAVAFGRARRALGRQWRQDDRSLSPAP